MILISCASLVSTCGALTSHQLAPHGSGTHRTAGTFINPGSVRAGYLPSSGGLLALDQRLAAGAMRSDTLESTHASSNRAAAAGAAAGASTESAPAYQNGALPPGVHANGSAPARRWWRNCDSNVSSPFVSTIH